MANSWLRLWHDMPNDPKWRTIARVSKQSISAVIAVYVHLLVIASNATERGRTQNVCSEDLASALDLDVEQVDAILIAMQGRVLDGEMISGWAKRQVEREDGAAERAKRWREARKEAKQTQSNATERGRTPDKDKDKDKEHSKEAGASGFDVFWEAWPRSDRKGGKAACLAKWKKAGLEKQSQRIAAHVLKMSVSADWQKQGGAFIPAPLAYLNQSRWDGADIDESAPNGMLAGAI